MCYNRRWWVADLGIGCAGLMASRSIRKLRKGMRKLYPRSQRVRYYVHFNPRMKAA